jgi:endonuclease G
LGGFNERDVEAAARAFMGLSPSARWFIVALILVAAGVAACAYYKQQHPTRVATTQPSAAPLSIHLLLGNPSAATADASDRNNFLMVKPYYALSYNEQKGTPNWVSWRLTEEDLGNAPRKRGFDPDFALPPGITRITQSDYNGSGFDRGHMCPHGDRAANDAMSVATFIMTNVVPQAPHVNQWAWNELEKYCRDEAHHRHQHLYVIAGPVGQGGRGSAGPRQQIGKDNVVVPAECWKIVVEVPAAGGDDDLAKITAATRVIAVLMPNDNDAVSYAWAGFRTSVAEVERKTGYHFFDRLPADVAAALRDKVDRQSIPPPRIPKGTED